MSDEDKELAQLLTGYQDMLGLLSIHKVARFNSQVRWLSFVVISYICQKLSNTIFKLFLFQVATSVCILLFKELTILSLFLLIYI